MFIRLGVVALGSGFAIFVYLLTFRYFFKVGGRR